MEDTYILHRPHASGIGDDIEQLNLQVTIFASHPTNLL